MAMATENRPLECKEFSRRLSRYADGDLSPVVAGESKRHLEGCPGCRAMLESHKRMILLLESSREVEAPWDLDLKVLEAIGFGGVRTQLRGYRVSPPAVWAASVAAMILLGAGGLAVRSGIARLLSLLVGPSGSLSAGEMGSLASKLTGYLVTIWEGFLAGLGTLQPLARSLGAVSDAAMGSPLAITFIVGTLAFVLVFFRVVVSEKRSRVITTERSPHANGL
jgi:hypothetical protein